MDRVSIKYMGFSSPDELKAHIVPPSGMAAQFCPQIFESGCELSPMGEPGARLWVVGRGRREGDPETLSAAEASHLAEDADAFLGDGWVPS
jgi:hypothetical protein